MAKVRVPKTPRTAFDKARRPSSLLLGQIEHLEWAVLPAAERTPDKPPARKVKTEGQAAERVAQLTTLLRESAAPAAMAPAAVSLPPLPKAAAPRKRRTEKRIPKTTRSARRRRSGR